MAETENRILIITGGQIEDAFLNECIQNKPYSMIIAADRGLAAADRQNINLDFIVGDFDSVPEEVLTKYKEISTPIQTFPKEKDKTDTQIAIELALMHNAGSIDLIGATGSRLDHVLANIHLLMLPMQLNIEAYILDPHNRISLRSRTFKIEKSKQYGKYVSLLPFSESVRGLTLKGFKYPLNNVVLSYGSSLGISNEIEKEEARVEFQRGILAVIESKD